MSSSHPRIHATAVIAPGAVLAADVEVGPYCVIGPNVRIGAGSKLLSHVVIDGVTTIGARNVFAPFCSIGGAPQDKKYAGEPTLLDIGDDNTVREYVTIHTGTTQDGGRTRVGHRNWIMAYCHIAHDCTVGNDTILASNAQIAGHVTIEDWAILGGMVGVHQFCRVGAHAMVGAGIIVTQDVATYCLVGGTPPSTIGINSEGLKRRGFSPETITEIKRAYKTVFREQRTLDEAVAELAPKVHNTPELARFTDFIAAKGRGLLR